MRWLRRRFGLDRSFVSPRVRRPYVLYRLYDRENRLLYVGRTINPAGRLNAHLYRQLWADEVAGATFQRFTDPVTLARAEVEAIRRERPRYNVVHNGRPHRVRSVS